MIPARRFAFGLVILAIAVGVIRGVIVGWVYHLPGVFALRLGAGQVALSSFWIPVGLVALSVLESRLSPLARAVAIVIVGAAALAIEPALIPILGAQGLHPPPYWIRFLNRADTSLLFYLAIVAAAAATAARRRQLAAELAAARLETAVADAQLHVLTLQLHPHFLFNALNLVSQLAYESIDAARRTIANLRSLLLESLRHALHREVSLAEEVHFIRAYLEIQEARFHGRLFSAIAVGEGAERAAVPHLLLQPLVENAIVHGFGRRANAGHLEITARRVDSRLILSVRDDGDGVRGPLREGLGLGNARLRLDQLFGGDYRLELVHAPDRGVIVTIEIPYRDCATETIALSDEVFATGADTDGEASHIARSATRVSSWLPIAAAWAAIAILWTELRVLSQTQSDASAWPALMLSDAVNAALWVMLTPIIVRFARWAGLAGQRSKRFVLAHSGGAIVAGVGHTGLWIGTLYLIGSSDLWPIIRSMFGWMIWDAGAYIAIVAMTTLAALSARIRDARIAVARRRARLAEARLAAFRLRLQPRVLIGTLDALDHVISIDAERSEAAITRMGDLLRLLLARAEQEWVRVDEEVELLTAYLDVMNAWRLGVDEPRPTVTVDRRDERIPAMLLLTMAAALAGDLDEVSIRDAEGTIIVGVSGKSGGFDEGAVLELSERLAELYHGAERLLRGRARDGEQFVHVEIPTTHVARIHSKLAYGLASA